MADAASVNESTVTSDSIMDRPLSQLTYKELQSIAMLIGLPANLKSQMLTMVQARQQGRENIVRRVLAAYREQRSRARLTNPGEPAASKRRRLNPKCSPSAPRQLPTILPQPPRLIAPMPSIISAPPAVQISSNTIPSPLISSSTTPQRPPQLASLAWQCQPGWFAANTTAVENVPLFKPPSDYQPLPYEGILNPGMITTRIQPAVLPNQPCQTSFFRNPQVNQYYESSLMSQQPPIFPDSVMQFVNQPPQVGVPCAYVGGEVGMSTVVYEPFFPTYSTMPTNLAENTMCGQGPVWGQPQPASPLHNIEAMTAAERIDVSIPNQDFTMQQGVQDALHQPDTKDNEYQPLDTQSLEMPTSIRMQCDLKYEFPSLGSNTTSTFRCYSRPICSVRSSVEPVMSSSSIPLSHFEDIQEDCCEDECCAEPCNPDDPISSPLYSQFHDDNKLSLPLIYNYIASTEDLLLGQPPQLQDEVVSQSVSSSPEVITQLPLEADISPEQTQATPPIVPSNSVASDPPNKSTQNPCCYQANGCLKQLLPDLLCEHEAVCPYQPISCPLRECTWNGKIRCLEDHFSQFHSEKILHGTEASHVILLEKIRENESMHFIQQTNGKIYVIAAHYVGHLLRITMQAVVVDKLSSYMKGSLEVVGSDGHPYGWWGNIHAISKPLFTLWNQGLCLTVDPELVGTYDGCITVHSTLFGSTLQRKSGRKRHVTTCNS